MGHRISSSTRRSGWILSSDIDEIPHDEALTVCKGKEGNAFIIVTYMFNGNSQVCCIKPEGRVH